MARVDEACGERACVHVGVASVRFSGYPQEVGNEEFLSLMSSHQVPCMVHVAAISECRDLHTTNLLTTCY